MSKSIVRVMCSDCRNHGGSSVIINESEYVIATPGAAMGVKESLSALNTALGGLDKIIFTPHTSCAGEKLLLEPEQLNCAHSHLTDLIPWTRKEIPNAELSLELAMLEGTETSLDISQAEVVKEFSAPDLKGEETRWKLVRIEI